MLIFAVVKTKKNMKQFFKKLFCSHTFTYIEVWENGTTDNNGITDLALHTYATCKKCGVKIKIN